jgi:glycosyltransferase involved in cell wall biosynthesis
MAARSFVGLILAAKIRADPPMNVLFITRQYPPAVGGMQTFASQFFRQYRAVGRMDLLANTGGIRTLPWFLLRVLFAIALHGRTYSVIHLYDAVLSPILPLLGIFSKGRTSVTVNGLDVVFSRFGYQRIIPSFLKRADRIIAISEATRLQCEARGLEPCRLRVIPVGVDVTAQPCAPAKKSALSSKHSLSPESTTLLLTVGRLVKRKGHAWFIDNVLPRLPSRYVYVVVGSGPEEDRIRDTVKRMGLLDRVRLLGTVSDEERDCLFQLASLFVMPNTTVEGDQEGFGIVALEAGCHGLPVVATDIEGIRDAVIEGQTGRLVPAGDAQAFVDAILKPNIDRSRLRRIIAAKFGWPQIAARYHAEFLDMLQRGT